MLFVVFTYNREQMLMQLLDELHERDVLVVDDGSDWSKDELLNFGDRIQYIRTTHTGKKGFWRKWVVATQIALGTNHKHFVFLPDDVSNIDIDTLKVITEQDWDDTLFALNITNGGSQYRWGEAIIGQGSIELNGKRFDECCYIDGCFITNRYTLEHLPINQVTDSWHDRPNKSSGVGYQMTMNLRKLRCPMLRPDKSLAYHGDHDSRMNYEERKNNPLITKQ